MPMELITIIATIISANIALTGLIIRIVITGQNSLRREIREQRDELQAHRAENQTEFKAMRAETQGEFRTTRNETQAEFKTTRKETQAEFKTTRKETQAESRTTLEAIGELRERMAHLEGLIEGLREALTVRRVAEDGEEYGK